MTQIKNETYRPILRPLRYSDAGAIEIYVSDVDVADMTARIPHPYPQGGAQAFLEKAIAGKENGQNLARAIVLKENEDNLIGIIGIENLTESEPEIGYWLGKPYWGRGLMTEALESIARIAFLQHSVSALYARTFLHNVASKKVLLKCGFIETGKGICSSPAREEQIIAANLFELQRQRWAGLQEEVN